MRILIKHRLTRDGELECLQPERKAKLLRSFKPGAILNETLEPVLGNIQRSNKQNKYYWKVVIGYIADYTGYLPDEVHKGLAGKFLCDYTISELPRVRSTAELSTSEFEEYLERCRDFGAEFFGLDIPEPNEVDH